MQNFIAMTDNLITGENVSLALFFIGVYGIIARRNILKSIISLSIMQASIILFFLSIRHTDQMVPPIGIGLTGEVADPLPQALMITAIVIGVSVTALSLTMFTSLYHKYGSTNWKKVKQKRGDQ
ncbi:MAG: multicomponent Na+:H+ antiporter subunit [Clostridiales bacterium]|nr:multicomponent Na+:H+ antiporter subunit [Clostridiales bacterium]MDN5297596.1 multicomponent Na+:H+ antiporter subunit [Clostridiales bacterium]